MLGTRFVSRFARGVSVRFVSVQVEPNSSSDVEFPFQLTWNSHVVGWLPSKELNPSKFKENTEFSEALYEVLHKYSHLDPVMKASATEETEGWGHILDKRKTIVADRIPEVDNIFGSVKFEDGKPVEGSFQASGMHRLLTTDGTFILPSFFDDHLSTTLEAKKEL